MKQKPRIASKPKQVKLPSTIYLIQDIFCDYDGCWTSIIGFEYSREKAEKIRETRAKTMEDEKIEAFEDKVSCLYEVSKVVFSLPREEVYRVTDIFKNLNNLIEQQNEKL